MVGVVAQHVDVEEEDKVAKSVKELEDENETVVWPDSTESLLIELVGERPVGTEDLERAVANSLLGLLC